MAFADPNKNIENLSLGEDMRVLDVGAGSGAYTFAAAAKVPLGTVYALDVQKVLLEKLKSEGNHRGLRNIETVWADAEVLGGTKLRDSFIDAVIISNVLFQMEDKAGLVKEIARVLRRSGKILLIDWSDSFSGLGPHQNEIITANKAKNLFESTGKFKVIKEFSAGDHHYGLIFERT